MNAKQRNKNRETAHNLRLSTLVWVPRNRRLEQPKPQQQAKVQS